MRSTHDKVEYRVIFMLDRNTMILLHGFTKASRRRRATSPLRWLDDRAETERRQLVKVAEHFERGLAHLAVEVARKPLVDRDGDERRLNGRELEPLLEGSVLAESRGRTLWRYGKPYVAEYEPYAGGPWYVAKRGDWVGLIRSRRHRTRGGYDGPYDGGRFDDEADEDAMHEGVLAEDLRRDLDPAMRSKGPWSSESSASFAGSVVQTGSRSR